jgi:hypothetical protein
MPNILIEPDSLDVENRRFTQTPLGQPIFLNSVPKSGSHLLRNIVRMFVPVEQQYQADFIQWANLGQHRAAFDPAAPKLSWGHLFLADASLIETAPARRILLYRDPYDWVIARARFFLSEQFSGNVEQLKSRSLSSDELLTMMIFGIPGKAPSLNDIYEMNAAAWLGARVHVVKFEDLVGHVNALESLAAERFFTVLLDACGVARPEDWRERIKVGADRKQSGTARENLSGVEMAFPEELSVRHKALVDYQAPGLRAILGYA